MFIMVLINLLIFVYNFNPIKLHCFNIIIIIEYSSEYLLINSLSFVVIFPLCFGYDYRGTD